MHTNVHFASNYYDQATEAIVPVVLLGVTVNVDRCITAIIGHAREEKMRATIDDADHKIDVPWS